MSPDYYLPPPKAPNPPAQIGGQDAMLLVVLCSFSVPFGKLFSKIISNYFGSKVSSNGRLGITVPTAPLKVEEVAL